MSSKNKLLFLIFFLIFFIFPPKILALTLNIDSVTPTDISDKDQEVSINLTVSDLPTGDSYFRVGIDSGSSYVGYIKDNAGNWIRLQTLSEDKLNLQCNNYFKISTDGVYVFNFKIGQDITIDNGSHLFKAHRFTSSCASNAGSNEFSVNLSLPTPTPSPTPTATQEPTSTPTKTPTITPTATSTPKPTPTKTATSKSTATPTEIPTDESTDTVTPILIGLNNGSSTPEGMVAGVSTTKKPPIFSILLIVAGLVFMIFGGVNLYKKMKTEYNKTNEK